MAANDAFTAGVRPGGLTNSTEIRLLLCYLVKNAGPITRTEIENALMEEALVNYFEIGSCLDDITRQSLVTLQNDRYAITEKGRKVAQELNLLANAIVSFSCAMQVQTFRKVNGYAYASTMCIGNMRSGMEALAVWIVKHDPKALRKVFHYLGIIFLFGVGAGLGWVAVEHFATRAIWWSCLLLVICFALMFIREDLEDNPAIEQDLAEIRQEAGEIDHLLKEELHEEHEALRDTLEHKN